MLIGRRPHVPSAAEDAEPDPQPIARVVCDWIAEVQLADHRPRRVQLIGRHPQHLGVLTLNLGETGLQLNELLLASPSTSPFVEVEDDLRSVEIRQRHLATRGRELRLIGRSLAAFRT